MSEYTTSTILQPPAIHNTGGEKRRVGFELEISGLELDQIANVIAGLYGGEIIQENPYKYRVANTPYGTFTIEVDFTLLKDRAIQSYFEDIGIKDNDLKGTIETVVAKMVSTVVPYEIVFPPIMIDQIETLDSLREALFREKALGTRASAIYAFGLHLNPEAPSFEAEVLLSYLRAFFLLYDWLKEKTGVNITRKITPFINPFPKRYVLRVLDEPYSPTLEELIDDYLKHNPTRNRPLDMLPLFAFLDKERVLTSLNGLLVKPRPTFHYRLPNSLVDDPSWRISQEWNRWVQVEILAFDTEKIAAMSRDYMKRQKSPWRHLQENWAKRVEYWLR